jgi:hypothetical protein
MGNRDRAIILEVYRAFVLLGAKSDLLGTIGSWEESLPDADVLANLKGWNEATFLELKDRKRHYEVACPHREHIPEAQHQTFPEG